MIAPPSEAAYGSLGDAERQFLYSLPHRVELHAHLNGSIPLHTLEELARERNGDGGESADIQNFRDGIQLEEIGDFFHLFPAIYALTDTAEAVCKVTVDVLHSFLGPNDRGKPEATALELRSTPRATPSMSKQQYVEAVLRGIAVVEQGVGTGRVGLILSVDRRMNAGDAAEIVDLAAKYVGVVGVDLCGDMFRARDLAALVGPLSHVKAMGKGLTMHLYETQPRNAAEEDLEWQLLQLGPQRVGHATYLSERALEFVKREDICVELCLSSNVMCKTVSSVGEHHITRLLEAGVKVAICTDDPLPFRTGLVGELAVLLAKPPYGLGLQRDVVRRIADNAHLCMF